MYVVLNFPLCHCSMSSHNQGNGWTDCISQATDWRESDGGYYCKREDSGESG